MTRRQHEVDPVDTMFKAMRLAEAVAAREQAKGEAANLKLMADSMMQAASMAEKIAHLQDRRGTAPSEPMPKVEIAIVDHIAGTCPKCGFVGCDPRPAEPQPARTIEGAVVKAPLSPLENSKRQIDLALGRRRTIADAPNFTPPPKPTPKLDYHPAVDFRAKETCIKNNTAGDIGRNEFVGAFSQPGEREFKK
jgi:hypothetical protein